MNTRLAEHEKERHELALALMDVGAVLTAASNHPFVVERQGPHGMERGFILKLHEKNPDAPLSPFFLNLRTPDNPKPGPLTATLIERSARCMQYMQIEQALMFDAVAGVPRAGIPFAEELARIFGMSTIVLEKWEHDGKRAIASPTYCISASIRKAVLVDDMITKADSKLEAIQVLRGETIKVTDVVVLIDREQGGREELTKVDCTLHSVFTITELLDLYVRTGRIQPQLRSDIQTYLAAA